MCMHDRVSLPKNLLEVVKGDQSDYKLAKIYFLAIQTELGRIFPVIIRTKRLTAGVIPLVTLNPRVLNEAVPFLEPRKATVLSKWAYVNESLSIAFLFSRRLGDDFQDLEVSTALKIFDLENIRKLILEQKHSFDWLSGSMSASKHPTSEEFSKMIDDAIEQELKR